MYQPQLTIEQLSLLIERSNDSVLGRIQVYLIGAGGGGSNLRREFDMLIVPDKFIIVS